MIEMIDMIDTIIIEFMATQWMKRVYYSSDVMLKHPYSNAYS